jgi:hypothetical protein
MRQIRMIALLRERAHLRADGMEQSMPESGPELSDVGNRRIGIALFNATWTLIEQENRTRDEDDAMLHMAHASRHHWAASGTDAAHLARAASGSAPGCTPSSADRSPACITLSDLR